LLLNFSSLIKLLEKKFTFYKLEYNQVYFFKKSYKNNLRFCYSIEAYIWSVPLEMTCRVGNPIEMSTWELQIVFCHA
jgi:hypothetical protein